MTSAQLNNTDDENDDYQIILLTDNVNSKDQMSSAQ